MQATQAIALNVPYDAPAIATLQREAEAELLDLGGIQLTCAEEVSVADDCLSETVRKKDAVEAMRQRATGPLNQTLKEIRAWFKPTLDALGAIEQSLKGKIGAYKLAEANAERELRAAAMAAAQANDAPAMVEALTLAAAPQAETRASIRFKWVVKRIAEDMLPDEWWQPNADALASYAAKVPSGQEPDPIPGVIFEQVPIVGARR